MNCSAFSCWVPFGFSSKLIVIGNTKSCCIQVVSRLARLPGGVPPRPLLKLPLTSEQWARMEEIHQALRQEYECRRHMMIKRFQVTVGSFHWGERGQVLMGSVPDRGGRPGEIEPPMPSWGARRQGGGGRGGRRYSGKKKNKKKE
nr:PREDICTED: protein FAM98C [Lepisosteus oculatus]